jgi:hypothetical protein
MVSTIIVDGICNVLSSRAVNLEWIDAVLTSMEGLASNLSAPGALVIWRCLRIICPFKLPRFVQMCDKSKGGTISLPEDIRLTA